jgi:hypothetical protein
MTVRGEIAQSHRETRMRSLPAEGSSQQRIRDCSRSAHESCGREPVPFFDSEIACMVPVWIEGQIDIPKIGTSAYSMADNNALYAIRFPDGSLSLYIDEDYAVERGVDPASLTRVEIPRDMFVSGTIQEIREYVALYLESRHSGNAEQDVEKL